jgi:long-chain fatty acid transport protein
MRSFRAASSRVVVLTAWAALCAAGPAYGAGFAIFEQGSKPMGSAMAFTAQADDPSALFYNVGGLGFFEERRFLAGATLIFLGDSEFQGAAPFPGPDATGDQTDQVQFPPHFYWVEPLGDGTRFKFGLAVTAPFGLVTEWDDPDTWSGRFVSERAELRSIDVTPSFGFRAGEKLALGIGAVARFSDVELNNRQAAFNPFIGGFSEVAKAHLESDVDTGYGFSAGLLHKPTDRLSWGFSYRSRVEIDYSGDARLTQVLTGNPTFDAIVASMTPFDQDLPIETSIEFPDQASLGLAYRFGGSVVVELDANWTGWSSFDTLDIVFTEDPALSQTLAQDWEDAYNYRLGVTFARSEKSQWRFGYYFDETPQPDQAVSPLLPDADRNGVTVGYGWIGSRFTADFALLYVMFDERTTTTNRDGFNGTYDTNVLLLGASLGW